MSVIVFIFISQKFCHFDISMTTALRHVHQRQHATLQRPQIIIILSFHTYLSLV